MLQSQIHSIARNVAACRRMACGYPNGELHVHFEGKHSFSKQCPCDAANGDHGIIRMSSALLCHVDRYTQSADIWSFGICLLELARGRVPISNCSFTSLVMQVVQNPAPTLHEYCGGHKFSQVSRSLCTIHAAACHEA